MTDTQAEQLPGNPLNVDLSRRNILKAAIVVAGGAGLAACSGVDLPSGAEGGSGSGMQPVNDEVGQVETGERKEMMEVVKANSFQLEVTRQPCGPDAMSRGQGTALGNGTAIPVGERAAMIVTAAHLLRPTQDPNGEPLELFKPINIRLTQLQNQDRPNWSRDINPVNLSEIPGSTGQNCWVLFGEGDVAIILVLWDAVSGDPALKTLSWIHQGEMDQVTEIAVDYVGRPALDKLNPSKNKIVEGIEQKLTNVSDTEWILDEQQGLGPTSSGIGLFGETEIEPKLIAIVSGNAGLGKEKCVSATMLDEIAPRFDEGWEKLLTPGQTGN